MASLHIRHHRLLDVRATTPCLKKRFKFIRNQIAHPLSQLILVQGRGRSCVGPVNGVAAKLAKRRLLTHVNPLTPTVAI